MSELATEIFLPEPQLLKTWQDRDNGVAALCTPWATELRALPTVSKIQGSSKTSPTGEPLHGLQLHATQGMPL